MRVCAIACSFNVIKSAIYDITPSRNRCRRWHIPGIFLFVCQKVCLLYQKKKPTKRQTFYIFGRYSYGRFKPFILTGFFVGWHFSPNLISFWKLHPFWKTLFFSVCHFIIHHIFMWSLSILKLSFIFLRVSQRKMDQKPSGYSLIVPVRTRSLETSGETKTTGSTQMRTKSTT